MREMKDSGIEWIGQIPKDWDKGHLKYYTQIKTGGTPSTSNQVWFDGDVLWFTPGDFDNILLNDSKRKLSNLAVLFRVANLFPANTTMIVGIGGTAGKVGYTIKESYCNQQITALINKSNTYPKYITYLMFCFSDVLKDNALYTTLPILNNQFIGDFSICIPKKLSEQRKITDYLDTQCSEIDATAEDIQKEISLLEDYKKSVITEAVTKGLNPNAEMKDSGIEWIGEIPKHWKIIKGKYVLEYLQKPVKDDDGVITCFRDGEVTLRSNRREDGFTLSDKEIGYQGIDVGDLVVHGMDGFAGAIGISDSRGKASPVLNVLNSKYNKRYLMYYLRSMAFSNIFVALASGIRVRSCDLRWNKLAELPYPTTNYAEQTEIVNYIDTKCSEIDTLIADKKRQLDILAEYKKSLIYEYVTGKKEVPVNE